MPRTRSQRRQQQTAAVATATAPTHGPRAVGREGAERVAAPLSLGEVAGRYEYDANQRLTRAGMEAAIRDRRSVLYQGRTITRVEDLPSAADLAGDDENALAAAEAGLQRQEEEIQRQRNLIQQRRGRGGKRPKDEPPAEAPTIRVTDDAGRPLVSGAVPATTNPDPAKDDDK